MKTSHKILLVLLLMPLMGFLFTAGVVAFSEIHPVNFTFYFTEHFDMKFHCKNVQDGLTCYIKDRK